MYHVGAFCVNVEFFSGAKNREVRNGVCVWVFLTGNVRGDGYALRELTSVSTGGFPGAETELTSVSTGGFRFRTMRFFRQRAGRGVIWYPPDGGCVPDTNLYQDQKNFFRRFRRAARKIFSASGRTASLDTNGNPGVWGATEIDDADFGKPTL